MPGDWSDLLPPADRDAIKTLASIPQGGSTLIECRSLIAAEDLAAKLRFALLNQVGYGAAVVRVVEVREVRSNKPPSFAVRVARTV